MPIRMIQAPGVEINELDKSAVAPAIIGTSVLVAGFSNKGEAYNPIDVVSISDLEANFGEPTNEAERYFYYACREVLNENGNLIAAKLPYPNDFDKTYKYITIDVDTANSVNNEFTELSGELSGSTSSLSEAIPNLAPALENSYVALSGNITEYCPIEVGSVQEMAIGDYDIIKAGGDAPISSTGISDFYIVCERKNKITGPNADEGVFITVIDPLQGMLQQRTIAGPDNIADNDIIEIVDNKIGLLSKSKFVDNISGTYRNESISEDMAAYFPSIEFTDDGKFISNEYGDWITVIVSRTISNVNQNGDLEVAIVEQFSGSLNADSLDPSNGQSNYIGNVINKNSNYIRLYPGQQSVHPIILNEKATTFVNHIQDIDLLSFNEAESDTAICGAGIINDLGIVMDKLSNIDDRPIDLVVDAGLSTIAAYTVSASDNPDPEYSGYFVPSNRDASPGLIANSDDTSVWRAAINTLDTFCAKIRKDCMTIADGPRNLILEGDEKLIRKTKPTNTFSNSIGPKLKYLTGINSSYTALYTNWTRIFDLFSGVNTWLPPSIKAVGIYCRNDRTANIWDAPAGLNRGIITEANELSFNPRPKEAGMLYKNSFNFAKHYPLDGPILEGQKTTQVKPSAFDRVNVRRLFLQLERFVYKVSRYFVYEPNNLFTRRRLVATIRPLFDSIKTKGGMYDFKIVCDESNNPPTVIDNNELKVGIAIQPVRTAEFILVDFIAMRTGGDFSEVL